MNYGNIKECDIADGPGVRVTLFVSGCRHHCKGCFNSETWDFQYGVPFTEETKEKILELLKPGYIQGFTLLGGEPFEPEIRKYLSTFERNQEYLSTKRYLVLQWISIRQRYAARWCCVYRGYERDAAPD